LSNRAIAEALAGAVYAVITGVVVLIGIGVTEAVIVPRSRRAG